MREVSFIASVISQGKQIVTQYPTNSEYTVHDKAVWYSDDWTAAKFEEILIFSTIFPQFRELMLSAPRMARVQQGNMENSEFCNRASDCKIVIFYSSNGSEDSYYGAFLFLISVYRYDKCR